MGYLNDFVALGIIGLLGAISPGPDFIIVSQTSLIYGRSAGIFTALGIALGCMVHFTYCILGIGLIVAESVLLFNIIKYLGAAYLIYLGIKGITGAKRLSLPTSTEKVLPTIKLTPRQAIQKGFLVNILNPKVSLFMLSIFTQLIDPSTPLQIQASLGMEFCFISAAWFSLLALILTLPELKKKLISAQHTVEKILGGFLILLGIKVALLK